MHWWLYKPSIVRSYSLQYSGSHRDRKRKLPRMQLECTQVASIGIFKFPRYVFYILGVSVLRPMLLNLPAPPPKLPGGAPRATIASTLVQRFQFCTRREQERAVDEHPYQEKERSGKNGIRRSAPSPGLNCVHI